MYLAGIRDDSSGALFSPVSQQGGSDSTALAQLA
jgi:hypothetical protein